MIHHIEYKDEEDAEIRSHTHDKVCATDRLEMRCCVGRVRGLMGDS